MAHDEADWRTAALDLYRLTWSELLAHWKGPQRGEIEFYVEELKEALLDLKEAVMTHDEARALHHIEEVTVLLAELRLRSNGE